MIDVKEFARLLGESVYDIEFTKADGTVRKMRATRMSDHIPSEKAPKKSTEIKDGQTYVHVFDLDILEFRSVTVANLIKMEQSCILST